MADITLTVYFDGGYVYDFEPKDRVEVATLGSGPPMTVTVLAGSPASPIALEGARLQIQPNGKAPNAVRPGVPPLDESADGCKSLTPSAMNNLFFIPDLHFVAKKMETELKEKPETRAAIDLTGGGALSVAMLGGCVQFKKDGKNIDGQRWMVSGVEGMVYQWPTLDASFIRLLVKPFAGEERYIDVKPSDNRVVLSVSAMLRNEKRLKPPYKIEHFSHLFGAFKSPKSNVTLHWLHDALAPDKKGVIRSPGIDCPPGRRGP